MSNNIRADKELLVASFGIFTSLLTGAILGFFQVKTGYAIYSFMLWFIIPVGAILAGLGAASGYYAGATLFNQKPAGGILLNMVGASIGAFLIVHYIPYNMLEIEGLKIRDAVSFWRYMDIEIRNTSISFIRGKASTGELGAFWGYAYACLQLIGFSFGGMCVFAWLSQNPFCENCSKYLKKTGVQERYMTDSDTFLAHSKQLIYNYGERK